MKTTFKANSTTQQKDKSKSFFEFAGGEFLKNPKVVQWYPYILFIFILIFIILYNDYTIYKKQKEIDVLDLEYKVIKQQLREKNRNLIYDIDDELMYSIENNGFIKNDKSIYKISIITEKNDEK